MMSKSGPLVLQELYDFMHTHGYWSNAVSADWTALGYVNLKAPRLVAAMKRDSSVNMAVMRIIKQFRYGTLISPSSGSMTLFPVGKQLSARTNPRKHQWRPERDRKVTSDSMFSWMRSWWMK